LPPIRRVRRKKIGRGVFGVEGKGRHGTLTEVLHEESSMQFGVVSFSLGGGWGKVGEGGKEKRLKGEESVVAKGVHGHR